MHIGRRQRGTFQQRFPAPGTPVISDAAIAAPPPTRAGGSAHHRLVEGLGVEAIVGQGRSPDYVGVPGCVDTHPGARIGTAPVTCW